MKTKKVSFGLFVQNDGRNYRYCSAVGAEGAEEDDDDDDQEDYASD